MTFDEYQQAMQRTAGPTKSDGGALQLSALGLCGESGEVADLVKKHIFHGHPLDPIKVAEELGDVLWYVARTCEAINVPLDVVASRNIAKLKNRYPDGFSSERSINRSEQVPCTICSAVGYHSFSCANKGY